MRLLIDSLLIPSRCFPRNVAFSVAAPRYFSPTNIFPARVSRTRYKFTARSPNEKLFGLKTDERDFVSARKTVPKHRASLPSRPPGAHQSRAAPKKITSSRSCRDSRAAPAPDAGAEGAPADSSMRNIRKCRRERAGALPF